MLRRFHNVDFRGNSASTRLCGNYDICATAEVIRVLDIVP